MKKRILAAVLAAVMAMSVFSGCSHAIKGTGGTPVDMPKEGDYTFNNFWLNERSGFSTIEDETWRLGTMGSNSVKFTSGQTAGVGGWYAKELPENWIFTATVDFSGVKDAFTGAIHFGPDKDTASISATVQRNDEGQLCISLKKGDETLATTEFVKAKDTKITLIIDNYQIEGKWNFYATGDEKLAYGVQVDMDTATRETLKTFAFSSDKPSLSFSDIGLNTMLYKPGMIIELAKEAQQDMYKNFWDEKNNRMHKENQGLVANENIRQQMIWSHAMMVLEMYSLYQATGDEDIKNKITAQWEFTKENFTREQLTGNFGNAPNIAVDDSGWDAMIYMVYYRITEDPYALEITKDVIKGTYEYYKDGDTENGLWYPQTPPSQGGDATTRFKSLYSVGVVSAALDYMLITGDKELLADTMKVYQWMEENLRRDGKKTYPNGQVDGSPLVVDVDDNLYWMDFNVDREGQSEVNGPAGGLRPTDIGEAGSVSGLCGNMGMAVIQARLYKLQGDDKYKKLALETVRAINDSTYYNNKGVYVNDRDAWTNATFMPWWVSEVLTLDGVTEADKQRVYDTALSIILNCRTEEGYYRAEWSGGNAWANGDTTPEQIMTSANTVGMVTAAAWLEKLDGKVE